MPADLALQIEPIHEAVQAARLAGADGARHRGRRRDRHARAMAAKRRLSASSISTGDKDLAQLVDERRHADQHDEPTRRLDVAGVPAKFGVPPERIVDYLALIGDSVDNVPGRRQGRAEDGREVDRRARLARRRDGRGAVDEGRGRREPAQGARLAAAGPAPGHRGDRLRPERRTCSAGRRSMSLALGADRRDGLLGVLRRATASSLRRELEATHRRRRRAAALRPTLPPAAGDAGRPRSRSTTRPCCTRDALDAWIARSSAAPLTALDTETDTLDGMRARIVGISLVGASRARPPTSRCATTTPARRTSSPRRRGAGAPEALARERRGAAKVGQNIKYDSHVFANAGITVRG